MKLTYPKLILGLLLISSFAMARSGRTYGDSTVRLLSFHLTGYALKQAVGGEAYAAMLSYTPTIRLSKKSNYFLRFDIGASYVKGIPTNFLIYNYEAYLGKQLGKRRIIFEIGGGAQNWEVAGIGQKAVLSAGFIFPFKKTWLLKTNRIVLHYSYFMLTGNATHQLRLGFGIDLL